MLGFLKRHMGSVEVVEQQQHQVSFRMEVAATVREEGGVFYSSCPVLDVHSQGESEQQALANLTEALQLFIETCYEQGTLGQVLHSHGLVPGNADELVAGGRTVEVPLALIARQHAQAHAH
jgi:predicted RNase H-like HicB family nuclease